MAHWMLPAYVGGLALLTFLCGAFDVSGEAAPFVIFWPLAAMLGAIALPFIGLHQLGRRLGNRIEKKARAAE